MDKRRDRESNIELLRILAMLGVIILHYNNPSIGGGLSFVKYGSLNYWFLNIVESIFVCAVNLFMIISAYFMASSNKRDLWKPIQLLAQVIIFSVSKYTLISMIKCNFSVRGLIGALIPANYFVILYIVVFIISPYINLIFEHLDSRKRKLFICTLILLFSVYPTIVDVLIEVTKHSFNGLSSIGMYGSQYGYSIVNFALCYCVGAYIRFESEYISKVNTSKLVGGLLSCVIIMTVWSSMNDKIGYFTEKTAWEYCNPLVIMLAVCAFLLFKRINIKNSKLIYSLAQGSFTVYLIHINLVMHVGVKFFVNNNIFILILHMALSSALIYFVCWIVYLIYSKLEKAAFGYIKKKIKLPLIEI